MAGHYPAHPGPGPSNYYMHSQPQPQTPSSVGPPTPGQVQNYPYGGVPNGYPYHGQFPGPAPGPSHGHPGMPPPQRANGRGASGHPHANGNGAGSPYVPQHPHPNAPQNRGQEQFPALPNAHPHPNDPAQHPNASPSSPLPLPPPQAGDNSFLHSQVHHSQLDASASSYAPSSSSYAPPSASLYAQIGSIPASSSGALSPPASNHASLDRAREVEASVLLTPPASPSPPALSPRGKNANAVSLTLSPRGTYTSLSPRGKNASLGLSQRLASPSPPPPHYSRGGGGYVIRARRPADPARAPGVMISPRARPPKAVVEGAEVEVESAAEERVGEKREEEEVPAEVVVGEPAVEKEEAVSGNSEAQTAQKGKEEKAEEEREKEAAVMPTPDSAPIASSSTSSPGGKAAVDEVPKEDVAPAAEATVTDANVGSDAPVTPTPTPAEAEAPATAAGAAPTTAPAPPAPKKSWASLLRAPPTSSSSTTPSSPTSAALPSSTPSSASASTRRPAIPVSSVVGFSIPGNATPRAVQDARAEEERKREVRALLAFSGGPSASSSSSAAGKLAPRGLINTGNMCFANAVLQVLVYCAPFAGLFVRLGALLPLPLPVSEGEGAQAQAQLVRATGEFLGEFYTSGAQKGEKEKEKRVQRNGKGKEREGGEGDAGEQEREQEAFIPTGVYEALKEKKRFDGMRGGHQEDAEEFLGFYLDTLEEELLALAASLAPPSHPHPASSSSAPASATTSKPLAGAVEEREEEEPQEGDGWLEVGRKNRTVVTRTIKTAESPITRIFGGTFRSTLRAPGQKDSVIVEGWRSLRLDIQRDQIHTVEDALAFIARPQPVTLSRPASSAPSASATPTATAKHAPAAIDASQQVLIDALPPVLILHVKRFYYDKEVAGVVKVGKRVGFGPELEVGADVMSGSARKAVRYKLFGAIYHHGVSAAGGHYTLDVLHPTRFGAGREGWVRIDDELVSDVRPDDVFGAGGTDDARCAYLLFYRRIR
ncbi:hypothetical protein B0H11DRAFT_1749599 [Mycena galericulata]|nr:hypothetical protein B0H11DRAFT_1749599 [Mycena galericulata]